MLKPLQVMLVCQSFGLLLGTVVMVPKTAQTVSSARAVVLLITPTCVLDITHAVGAPGWSSQMP